MDGDILMIQTFKKFCHPKIDAEEVCSALVHAMYRFGIQTAKQKAAFLGQCAIESTWFHDLVENLNYGELALATMFGKYFPPELAKKYSRKPEQIANVMYANRMGNGDRNSGDGWRFRGRGFLQLTGRDNYKAAGTIFGEDFEEYPDLVATPKYAALVSAAWWNRHNGNKVAESLDWQVRTSRLVNRGSANSLNEAIHEAERVKACNLILKFLKEATDAT